MDIPGFEGVSIHMGNKGYFYDIEWIKSRYSSSDVDRISESILPGDVPTEEQRDLVECCEYAGSMNVSEIKDYLKIISKELKKLEEKEEKTLEEFVEDVQDICGEQVCPYCQSKLRPAINAMVIICTNCAEEFPYLSIAKTRWFPKVIKGEKDEY